ncbi:MAG TPA: hypothetical protein VKB76_01145, partial [Ktedonobacterales bacterium]|nr:hypothetical protein [Ktedonobacterales bacterium]
DCLIDERANLERFFLQGNSTLRDTRHIEEIIDEPNELIGLTGDHREQTLRIRIGSDQTREQRARPRGSQSHHARLADEGYMARFVHRLNLTRTSIKCTRARRVAVASAYPDRDRRQGEAIQR